MATDTEYVCLLGLTGSDRSAAKTTGLTHSGLEWDPQEPRANLQEGSQEPAFWSLLFINGKPIGGAEN